MYICRFSLDSVIFMENRYMTVFELHFYLFSETLKNAKTSQIFDDFLIFVCVSMVYFVKKQ